MKNSIIIPTVAAIIITISLSIKLVGEIAGPESMIFVVTFDNDGKVIAYNSVKEHPYYHPY